jgi:hypothetical protein
LLLQIESALNGTSANYQPTMSLIEFFSKYAEANSGPYANFVAQRLGVTPDTALMFALA